MIRKEEKKQKQGGASFVANIVTYFLSVSKIGVRVLVNGSLSKADFQDSHIIPTYNIGATQYFNLLFAPTCRTK